MYFCWGEKSLVAFESGGDILKQEKLEIRVGLPEREN